VLSLCRSAHASGSQPCTAALTTYSVLPCPAQSFASLSSTAEKAGSIVSQIIGGTVGEVQEYGELMIQTRYGEEVRVSCKGARAGTGGGVCWAGQALMRLQLVHARPAPCMRLCVPLCSTQHPAPYRLSLAGLADAVRVAKIQLAYPHRYPGLLVVSPASSRVGAFNDLG